METMDLNKDKRTRKRKRLRRDDPITWGKLKQLQHTSTVMATVGASPTPVDTFLACLAIISSNSTGRAGKPPGVCVERCG
uniref:Uncharacterized protein n=1 Tax=Calidris pygmaea TaxID=425635 RepID=A0A8C3JMJ0_9CHAR